VFLEKVLHPASMWKRRSIESTCREWLGTATLKKKQQQQQQQHKKYDFLTMKGISLSAVASVAKAYYEKESYRAAVNCKAQTPVIKVCYFGQETIINMYLLLTKPTEVPRRSCTLSPML